MGKMTTSDLSSEYILCTLEEAIANHYIKVYYQPVVRGLSGALCGMEALARWEDPNYGIMPPDSFISVLEEHHLIHRLDLYMVRRICEELKFLENSKMIQIPVSFNLSRQDFFECDVFDEIERIVTETGTPRDMLNIEITESMVIKDSEMLKREIGRFQDAGYQVWMDDFGSGYSSLNVLKDFEFDEIKLDMAFLSSFSDRSRTIIRMIVEMAKEIGVSTLAEGVETEEQYRFLRSIGCEKIQGYLFGRPRPLEEFLEICKAQETFEIEDRGWREYYDKLGSIKFEEHKAFSITEFDGEKFSFPYISPEYIKVWRSAGARDFDTMMEILNSPASAFAKQLRDYQLVVQSSDTPVDLDCTLNGDYFRITATKIASHHGVVSFYTEATNMSEREVDMDHQTRMDQGLRLMQSMFDSFYILDLKVDSIESLLQSSYTNLPEYQDLMNANLAECRQIVADRFIYPDDREQYLAFTDIHTLKDRLQTRARGFESGYFRTKNRNGSYVWKTHIVRYVASLNSVIYATAYAPMDQEGLVDKLTGGANQITDTDETKQLLWKNLMDSQTISLFWKDKERRFIGANKKFLDTYGFHSVDEIIGKTDEDMHWHIDNDVYRNEELRILKEGYISVNKPGRNIIQGIVHNIIATKEPLFQDGEIEGFFGYFTDVDDLLDEIGSDEANHLIDAQSGTMSSSGLLTILSDFVESWEIRGENFAVIRVLCPEYYRAIESYGEDVAARVLGKIGEIIMNEIRNEAVAARVFAGNFVILQKVQKRAEAEELEERISQQLSKVHYVDEHKVTLNSLFTVSCADEVEDVRSLIEFSSMNGESKNLTEAQKKALTEKVVSYIPGAVVVFSAADHSELRQIFASEQIVEVLGLDRNKKDTYTLRDMISYVHPDDQKWVYDTASESVDRHEAFDSTYRIYTDKGELRWVHLSTHPVRQTDGSYLFYGLYTDVSEQMRKEEIEEQQKKEKLARYESMLSGLENGSYEDLIARVQADVTEDRILKSWVGEEGYGLNVSGSIQDMFDGIAEHTFSDRDRENLVTGLDFKKAESLLRLQGFATLSGDYLRTAPNGQLYWSRIECKMLVDPETDHTILYVLIYNVAKGQIPPVLLQRMMSQSIEKLSIHNIENNIVQIYRIKESGDAIIGTGADYEKMCMDFAQNYISVDEQDSFCWSMSMKTVVMGLADSDGSGYRCSFWTSMHGERRRKMWSFSYANEERSSIMVARTDITDSYIDYGEYTQRIHEMSQELEYLKRDATGVLSRKTAMIEFRNRIENHKVGEYCVMIVDLDNLKFINDHFGHPAGDLAIKSIADALIGGFRSTDVIGRIGGDEFMVLFDTSDEKFIRQKADTIIAKIHEVIIDEESGHRLGCSIGYLHSQYGKYNFGEAYARVDKALYQAKKAGKGQAVGIQ